jgi:hypothetical protein
MLSSGKDSNGDFMLAGLTFDSGARHERHDFRFSHGAFRADEIFESATATPGRYILEIGRRLAQRHAAADLIAIANPLLPLNALQLTAWLGDRSPAPLILADSAGMPILYILPRKVIEEDGRLLLCMSTLDSGLDARLLGAMAGVEFSVITLPVPGLDAFPAQSGNGWLNPDRRLRALKRQAEDAVAIVESDKSWRSRPFALFHPYHAGDALFVALASKSAQPLLFEKQIVCSAFKDVVEAADPKLEAVELALPPMARDGSVSKYRYFVNALDRLGADFRRENFTVFGRLLRMHHFTPFHLHDHAKFTLGDPMERQESTLYWHGAPPRLAPGAGPLRALFHLNGGWALKTYPDKQVRPLFAMLRSLGWDITVLDRPDLESPGVRSIKAGTATALAAQIEAHHLFVGVDSFPLHFAALVHRRPTVGLFGSTRPCNHDAPPSLGYEALVGSLPCNTCLSKSGCPMVGGDDCANYPDALTVATAIIAMTARTYGFAPAAA